MLTLFLNELKQRANDERAIADKRYHKSHREHLGIPAGDRTELIRILTKKMNEEEIFRLAKQLWETNVFDAMLCTGKMLSLPKIPASKSLWSMILYFLKDVDGWALEDQLCHVAWKCILSDESLLDEVEKWTKHDNFWMRRAALVYTLPFAKPNRNPQRMLKWASSYASDPQWFIQKAIGWWLRVLGEHNPKPVTIFLRTHWEKLKTVAKKEATRKLNDHWKRIILENI